MNCFYNRKKQYKLSITLSFILSILVIYTFFYTDFTLLHKVFSQNNIEIVKQHQINGKKNITEFEENQNLSNVFNSQLGTEYKNIDNWITINHDIYGTRHSNQTIINKDNVANLQIKWILFNNAEIQEPPIIIGNTGYVQDYSGNVIAFDIKNGKIIWKVHIGTGPTMGLTFSNGVIFASTGFNSSAVALESKSGKIIWQSPKLGDSKLGYNVPSAPIVWNKYVVVGSAAGGDEPNGVGQIQGNITNLNISNGKLVWNLQTTAGKWVNSDHASPYNGDASAWSGGSVDPETGILYVPLGSPSPNFNASTRQDTPNLYANRMMAVNITDGNIIWSTPFIDFGTTLPVKVPDTHDWDTSWGSSIIKVNFDNGTQKKLVIGHDKMGNIMAMDASTGKEIWWNILGKQYNTNAIPLPNGSGMIWSYGVFNYHAIDDYTLYIAATNRGVNYFTDEDLKGHRIAAPNTIELGLHNGTIAAMDLKTGKLLWQYQTEFPPRVSPLVTNEILFAGGIPFLEKTISNHIKTTKSGIILALDKNNGKKLWEFNIQAPVSPVGLSIGQGMLFVPTGKIQNSTKDKDDFGGSIIALGIVEK
jgi:alcohol dehydrogenase (cytochrome c)